jgi:hypothetical protein
MKIRGTCLAPRKNPSRRPPPVIAFRCQHHRLGDGLLAAEIVSDGATGEAEGFGGAVEGEAVAPIQALNAAAGIASTRVRALSILPMLIGRLR